MAEGDIKGLIEGLPESPHPDWCPPMLAVLTEERFSDPGWLYERKLDGERLLVFRDVDRLRLMTRNHHEVSDIWPELAGATADFRFRACSRERNTCMSLPVRSAASRGT